METKSTTHLFMFVRRFTVRFFVCHGYHSFRSSLSSLRIQWNGMKLADEFEDPSLAETVDEVQRSLKKWLQKDGRGEFWRSIFLMGMERMLMGNACVVLEDLLSPWRSSLSF